MTVMAVTAGPPGAWVGCLTNAYSVINVCGAALGDRARVLGFSISFASIMVCWPVCCGV